MKLFRPDLFPEYAATAEADFAANKSGPYNSISAASGPTHLFLSFTKRSSNQSTRRIFYTAIGQHRVT